jgi:outer membrane protein TolC
MKSLFSVLLCCLLIPGALFAQTKNLNYYLEHAQASSPLLKDLRNQASLNQLDSLRLKAGFKPQVTASSGGFFAPVINGYGYSGAITNIQTFNALLGVTKSLIGKNYLNSQLAAVVLQRDSINALSQISEQDLKRSIITQYITAYGSLQQLKFAQEVVGRLSKEEDILKKLTRTNVYRQSDYLTFLVTLKQQQLTLAQARLQYRSDYSTLNYLAGIADTTMAEIPAPDIQRVAKPDFANSIFFRQYKLDSLRIANGKKLVDYSYRPRVNVFADGGYNSDFTGQAYKNFGTSFGFNVSMPIYDGGVKRLLYRRLALEEETRLNYKAYFDVQYRQQIAQLNQQINDTESLFESINEQIKYTDGLIKVDIKLMQTGDVKMSDLILAINNYLSVKNLSTQTTITRLQLINQLNYWHK